MDVNDEGGVAAAVVATALAAGSTAVNAGAPIVRTATAEMLRWLADVIEGGGE